MKCCENQHHVIVVMDGKLVSKCDNCGATFSIHHASSNFIPHSTDNGDYDAPPSTLYVVPMRGLEFAFAEQLDGKGAFIVKGVWNHDYNRLDVFPPIETHNLNYPLVMSDIVDLGSALRVICTRSTTTTFDNILIGQFFRLEEHKGNYLRFDTKDYHIKQILRIDPVIRNGTAMNAIAEVEGHHVLMHFFDNTPVQRVWRKKEH